ncbi:hypothetical protein DBV15_10232 [Temnothorax longispinosus]|uniref:Uncharacterized protein n=1 Tax=Temnothorax longispinosus TaxID=300112 RepID=A0A4S2KIX8_9HYME|nr:hypothetical protein DBV15_10232 [Temnothorax longispinosus]
MAMMLPIMLGRRKRDLRLMEHTLNNDLEVHKLTREYNVQLKRPVGPNAAHAHDTCELRWDAGQNIEGPETEMVHPEIDFASTTHLFRVIKLNDQTYKPNNRLHHMSSLALQREGVEAIAVDCRSLARRAPRKILEEDTFRDTLKRTTPRVQ